MIKKCAVIILIALLSFVRVSFVQADSGRMYELDNIIRNGDFSIDLNNNELADYFTSEYSIVSLNNGEQTLTWNGGSNYYRLQQTFENQIDYTNSYYITFDIVNKNFSSFTFEIRDGSQYRTIKTITATGITSFILNKNTYLSNYQAIHFVVRNPSINSSFTIKNFMIFNLTSIFGYGNEPSLSDFEMYYLPDLDYFDYYNSFDPTSYTQLNTTDYTNITTDLTGIDYSKSIIARNGDNMNLDFYAYFYDSPDSTGSGLALHYYNYNRPEMRYLGTDHALLWEYSDYSDRVLKLSLTDEQSDILKTILFNRVVDPDNEYFEFRIDAYFWDYVKIYVVMTSTFDLLVDVKSFMISRETVTLNVFNINNEMNVKTYDQNGDIYLPIIKLNLAGDDLETRVIDGFGSGYTRISRFNFEFEFTSPENDDPYAYELQYLYELGIFSSDDVLIPTKPTIPEYLDGIFPYQVCDAFQIGCHIKNGINDIVLWLWDALNINAIIAVFDSVILAVGSLVSLIPGGLSSLVLVFTGIIGIGIIITIYDRITKGGGD